MTNIIIRLRYQLLFSIASLFIIFTRLYVISKITTHTLRTWPLTTHHLTILNTITHPHLRYLVADENGVQYRWRPQNGPQFEPSTQLDILAKLYTFDPPTNPGEFDAHRYGQSQGILGTLTKVKILKHYPPNPWSIRRLTWRLHQRIVANNHRLLPAPYGDILLGFVFGDQDSDTPEDWASEFQTLGLTHLLVVSGAQVALLSTSILTLLSTLRLPFWASGTVLGVAYTLFYGVSGGGPSIARAIGMGTLAFIAKSLGRNTPALYLMTLAAMPLLWINPWCLFDVGFQLSFAATFALIWAKPLLETRLPIPMLTTPLAVFALTTPILWFHFHSLSTGTLVGNLAVASLAEPIVTLGFFSTLLSLIWLPLAVIPHHACWALLVLLGKITHFLAPFFPVLTLKHPPIWIVGLLLFAICWGLHCFSQKQFKTAGLILGLSLSLSILCTFPWPTKTLKITALDIGQGDALVIQTPDHQTLLIDTGNHDPRDMGKAVILPYLRYEGISHLDALILTHSDLDHIGGATALAEAIPIKIVYQNGYLPMQAPELTAVFQRHHIPLKQLQNGQALQFKHDLSLACLHPNAETRSDDSPNNQCLVLELTYGHFSALFTGDLEADKETLLLPQLHPVTLLKVGHHGSKTSSFEGFLSVTHPQFALISVGRHNTYGHPHPTVMRRFQAHHIPVIRTDQSGAITWLSNGDKSWIRPFISPDNSGKMGPQ